MTGLEGLGSYSQTLRLLRRQVASEGAEDFVAAATAHLDGLAGTEFRRVISAADRRAMGTFFTSSELRERAVRPHRRVIAAGGRVLDPACGFGDLLLAAADLLPARWTPTQRIYHASTHLHGRDLHAPLVDVAAQRLELWAQLHIEQKPRGLVKTQEAALPGPSLTTGDAFDGSLEWGAFSLVLLNPPYTKVRLETSRSWASGSVTQAAPFTLDVLARVSQGTSVAAILPDVLRTGARYERWREELEELAEVRDVDVYGKFDRWTNVDVFILHLKRRGLGQRRARVPSREPERPAGGEPSAALPGAGGEGDPCVQLGPDGGLLGAGVGRLGVTSKAAWWRPDTSTGGLLEDIAEVSAGDVVPHRHLAEDFVAPEGDKVREVGYLTIHTLPSGAELHTSSETVRFHGRTHQGPFAVLRRTSAPSRRAGTARVRAALYTGAAPVAVENHLIVVKLRSGSVDDLRNLTKAMCSDAVTEWLDDRLRVRHLTVTAIRQMPLNLLKPKANDD
jgi:hypothetical protein